jgi:hypothetical protein
MSSTSSIGSTSEVDSPTKVRSNIGSAVSLGDLADLFDGFSFGSGKNSSSDQELEDEELEDSFDDKLSVGGKTPGMAKDWEQLARGQPACGKGRLRSSRLEP